MSAHTAYMSLLFVCFFSGFIINVFVLKHNAANILLHALYCAGSVVIAAFMPEWMLWVSCGMMVSSLAATGLIYYFLFRKRRVRPLEFLKVTHKNKHG